LVAVREHAARLYLLQRVEREFDPFEFGVDAVRMFGRMSAAVHAAGPTTRPCVADLMIAATAAANGLPVYTTNPDDFAGLDGLVAVIVIPRPRHV
jgi:predicted nucleic acid-binding protein